MPRSFEQSGRSAWLAQKKLNCAELRQRVTLRSSGIVRRTPFGLLVVRISKRSVAYLSYWTSLREPRVPFGLGYPTTLIVDFCHVAFRNCTSSRTGRCRTPSIVETPKG